LFGKLFEFSEKNVIFRKIQNFVEDFFLVKFLDIALTSNH
jgi:hypothetical protein